MSSEIAAPARRVWEEPTLTRHTFGAINKFSGVAINTRAPLVPTTIVDEIDGCAVAELLRHFGSPLFVVSESRLCREFRDFRAAFRAGYPDTEIAYSYKTNYLTGIRALLHEEGAWAEVVSGLEYEMARRLGVPAGRIVFNGPWKADGDLERTVADGAWINVDSFDELTAVEEIARARSMVTGPRAANACRSSAATSRRAASGERSMRVSTYCMTRGPKVICRSLQSLAMMVSRR